MKELSTEEKARAYDEALKEAIVAHKDEDKHLKATLERIFPELKEESKDERIRKVIYGWIYTQPSQFFNNGFSKEDMLAWIEKQGEHSIYNVPSREVILAIWELGNDWKELTNRCISTEHGTQLEYIQKHWNESEYYLREKQGEKKPADYENPNIQQNDFAPKSAMEAINEEKVDNANKIEPKDYSSIDPHFFKPDGKAEPKFKVGNWYQCTKDFFGKGVTFDKNTAYYCAIEGCLQDEYGCHIAIVKDLYDNFKLWDIKDAKPGDVLTWDNGRYIVLFEKLQDKIIAHCSYNTHSKHLGFYAVYDTQFDSDLRFFPATKEQCDLLFKAMHEAGYMWDTEGKQLVSLKAEPVEQKSSEWSREDEQNLNAVLGFIDDEYLRRWLKDAIHVRYDKQEWTEKDEIALADALWCCKQAASIAKDENDMGNIWYAENWLKSIKDRVLQQPQQKWSEEDEKVLCKCLGALGNPNYCYEDGDLEHMRNWLKSLRPQNKWKESLATADLENSLCDIQDAFSDTSYEYRILGEAIEFIRCTEPKPQWKPSDEQMKVLNEVLNFAANHESSHWNDYIFGTLNNLIRRLKKLK